MRLLVASSKYSAMKASSKRKSSSATFCIKGVFKDVFFLVGLTTPCDVSNGRLFGVPSKTVWVLTVPFGSLCVGQSKYFLNEGSDLSTNLGDLKQITFIVRIYILTFVPVRWHVWLLKKCKSWNWRVWREIPGQVTSWWSFPLESNIGHNSAFNVRHTYQKVQDKMVRDRCSWPNKVDTASPQPVGEHQSWRIHL